MNERPIALVTGASRGVGEAIARALAPTHRLILGGRDREALEKLAAELPDATAWPVDLTKLTAGDVEGFDRIDVLVHSAGIAILGTVAETPADVWRTTMELNVVAVAELTRLLLPALRPAAAHVVMINSGAGQRVNPGWTAYAASKYALRALADGLRQEEPALRVTSVYPGRVVTDMQRGIRAQEGADFEPEKYLLPETVARAVVAAIVAGPDAHLSEITLRPRGGFVN